MRTFSPILASKALWQLRIKKRPFVLSHGINARCNMHCDFCEYWKEEKDEMETGDILRMLDEAKRFGIKYYNAWTVEPLLRDDLPFIMAYARELGMITSMITNGKLLKQRAHELDVVDYLSVSVDGTDSYKDIRGMDFNDLLAGIEAANDGRRNPILMNCVISGQNLDDIEPLVHLAREMGVWISFEALNQSGGIGQDVWDRIGIQDTAKYERAVDSIIRLKKEGYPIINSLTYLKMVRDRTMDFTCHAADIILNVTSDGCIEHCRVQKERLGHASEGLEHVWESSKDQRARTARNCGGCLFFGYVEGSLLFDFKPEVMAHYEWI
ncbi:MAG: radical SAM protein [ANME-2 cluster archaeon]|nr:radical SAM protein [ANME-2 cluster archaeon]